MSDIIKLLPDSVANQIAAGEVIQRPASVIKELVENSIDAGATEISIVLKDAGRTLIQVIDNGKGMSATDARLSFERHSTSKIRNAEDLFSLNTMGFRGEALASIAAISQIELRTCRKEDTIGTKICIAGSKCELQEADMCAVGCNFAVKNLFYNVPARRKFLKSNQVELSNILKEFERLALVNHSVGFTLIHNDTTMYQFLGGSFKQRIIDLFGRSLDMQLIPMNLDTSLVKIEGFICKPENARKRNYLQYFFVNGRYMKHPYFHKAIMTSYEELIANDVQPNYFLHFKVEPETIDVNIHPTKTEIKFENEVPIWQIISAATKETLGKFSAVPSIDFDTEDAPDIPAYTADGDIHKPNIEFDPTYNPFESNSNGTTSRCSGRTQMPDALKDWEKLYNNFTTSKINENIIPDEDNIEVANGNEKDKQSYVSSSLFDSEFQSGMNSDIDLENNCLQIGLHYIVKSEKEGLLMIDQRRAHIKVLYDKYIKQIENSEMVSQGIMFPIVLHLTPAQNVIMDEISFGMNQIGFNLSQLSGNDWSVNGIPMGVENLDVTETILQVIDDIETGGKDLSTKLYEKIALSVAKKSAINYGKKLTQSEMDNLVTDLMSLDEPNYTPDGKKIFTNLNMDQLKKLL